VELEVERDPEDLPELWWQPTALGELFWNLGGLLVGQGARRGDRARRFVLDFDLVIGLSTCHLYLPDFDLVIWS